MTEAKPFSISKHLVVKAFRLVKANHGAAGGYPEGVGPGSADGGEGVSGAGDRTEVPSGLIWIQTGEVGCRGSRGSQAEMHAS